MKALGDNMSIKTQLKLFELYKGKTLKEVAHRLSIAEIFVEQRKTAQRIRLSGIKIGD